MLVRSCRKIFLLVSAKLPASRSIVPRRNVNIAGEMGKPIEYRNPKLSPFGYFLGALPVATFALGTWQCYRLNWKLGLIEKLESLVKNDPIELPEELEDVIEYKKYKVKGHFDLNGKPIFIFPRQFIDQSSNAYSSSGGGLISKSKSHEFGANMVVPFVVTDNLHQNKRILINLGWVPKKTMEAIQRSPGTLTAANDGDIELVGVLRLNEKRQPFQQKNSPTPGCLSRRSINKIAEIFQAEEIFLDDCESHEFSLDNRAITPAGSQTRVTLRNEHLSYILTWYSLTGIFSYYWYAKILKRRF